MLPNSLFNSKINILRATDSVDSGGSPISTFATHLSNVKCRVQPVSAAENVRAQRQASIETYRVYCDDALDINMKDKAVYSADNFDIVERTVYPGTYMKIIMSKTD